MSAHFVERLRIFKSTHSAVFEELCPRFVVNRRGRLGAVTPKLSRLGITKVKKIIFTKFLLHPFRGYGRVILQDLSLIGAAVQDQFRQKNYQIGQNKACQGIYSQNFSSVHSVVVNKCGQRYQFKWHSFFGIVIQGPSRQGTIRYSKEHTQKFQFNPFSRSGGVVLTIFIEKCCINVSY